MNILGQSIIGTTKKILYAGALLTLLNQDLSAQTKTPPPDRIFKTLEFKPLNIEKNILNIIDKIQVTNSYKELLILINTDKEIGNLFNNYLYSINKTSNELIGNATMGGFLLSIGIATDMEYNKNYIIKGYVNIDYNDIIIKFPLLSSLKIINHSPVKTFLVDGETELHGYSGMNGKIVIVDNHETKDATLLNEITGEIFSRYIEDIKQIYPELSYDNHIYLPHNIKDPIIDKLLGSHIIDNQRNEYRGDLSNLSFDSGSHIEHMLVYAIIEDGYKYSYFHLKDLGDASLTSAAIINRDYSTYLLSKHSIKKFILSQEFLSSILYKEGNLWEYYQIVVQEEAKNQFNKQLSSVKSYQDIAKELTTIIKNNPQALQKIQQRATVEKESLEQYLKSFQKR